MIDTTLVTFEPWFGLKAHSGPKQVRGTAFSLDVKLDTLRPIEMEPDVRGFLVWTSFLRDNFLYLRFQLKIGERATPSQKKCTKHNPNKRETKKRDLPHKKSELHRVTARLGPLLFVGLAPSLLGKAQEA